MLLFFNKTSLKRYMYFIEKYINFINSADLTFRVIRKMYFNRAKPTSYITNFPYASSGLHNGAFSYIVLRVIRLTCTYT